MNRTNKLPKPEVKVGFTPYCAQIVHAECREINNWEMPLVKGLHDVDLSPMANGLNYGQSIFEGMKAHVKPGTRNQILVFKPFQHLKRLNQSLAHIGMPVKIPHPLFLDGLASLFNKSIIGDLLETIDFSTGLQSLYIRPIVYNPEPNPLPYAANKYDFSIGIAGLTVNPYQPAKILVEDGIGRSIPGGPTLAKVAGNYAAIMRIAKSARERGYKHVLWLDSRDHEWIEELSGTSFFMIKNGQLHTPWLSSDTILDSITRRTVIEIMKDKIIVQERPIAIQEIVDGIESGQITEIFCAGTASTVLPFTSLTYKGIEYHLPTPKKGDWVYKIFNMMNKVYRGKLKPEFTLAFPITSGL